MRRLTEKGFLEGYLQGLSLNNTSSVNKLIKELPENPRILVPLAYYVCLLELPEKRVKKSQILFEEIQKIKDGKRQTEIQKLLNTYQYAAGKKTRDDNLKKLMHRKLLSIMSEKKITNYKLYKALDLDPSNVNHFIKNCDCDRVSIDNVRAMVQYAENL